MKMDGLRKVDTWECKGRHGETLTVDVWNDGFVVLHIVGDSFHDSITIEGKQAVDLGLTLVGDLD